MHQKDVGEIFFLVVVSVGDTVPQNSGGGGGGRLRLEPFWALLALLQDFNRTLLSREVVQEQEHSPCC